MGRKLVAVALGSLCMVLFLGCGGGPALMKAVPDAAVAMKPSGNEAIVCFMRPSKFASAIQASIFDVTTAENKLVGVVRIRQKVMYRVPAGEHLFMIISESADFIKANVQAGKTYYVNIVGRSGAWKARFSMRPLKQENLSHPSFPRWDKACVLVQNTEAAHTWAKANAGSIQKKREVYLAKWNAKPDKPILNPEDGR